VYFPTIVPFTFTVASFVHLQRTNTKNSKQIIPGQELRGHSPNFQIHVSVSDLYSAAGNMWTDPNRSQTHECGIGTEAAQFPDKKYKIGYSLQ
jgi:hypothetical protein